MAIWIAKVARYSGMRPYFLWGSVDYKVFGPVACHTADTVQFVVTDLAAILAFLESLAVHVVVSARLSNKALVEARSDAYFA